MRKVFCASPAYLEKNGFPNTFNDLTSHSCLEYTGSNKTWMVSHKGKPKEIAIEGRFETNDSIVLKQLAVSGLGIAYLPAYFIHEELMSGQLVSVLKNDQPADYALYAVYPTKKYIAKKTLLFINFVTTLLEKLIKEKEAEIYYTAAD